MKRGQISIETIVIIILALLALVIIAASFTGGMRNLWAQITGISNTTTAMDVPTAQGNCRSICNTPAFDTQSYIIQNVGPKTCRELGVTC